MHAHDTHVQHAYCMLNIWISPQGNFPPSYVYTIGSQWLLGIASDIKVVHTLYTQFPRVCRSRLGEVMSRVVSSLKFPWGHWNIHDHILPLYEGIMCMNTGTLCMHDGMVCPMNAIDMLEMLCMLRVFT